MKKKTKKLVLARETVRNLDLVRHRVVGGGDYTDDSCTLTCAGCTPYTFDHTCTTPDYTVEFTCNCNNTVVEPQTRRNC